MDRYFRIDRRTGNLEKRILKKEKEEKKELKEKSSTLEETFKED